MIIVKSWAKNSGKISQRQRVKYENWESAVEKHKQLMKDMEKQYNDVLTRQGLGVVKVETKETPKRIATTLSNEYIRDTVYTMEFERNM